MTRQQLKSAALGRIGLSFGDFAEGSVDPFVVDDILDEVVGEISRAGDWHYLTLAKDLTANDAKSCFPGLYRLDIAELTFADGVTKRNLAIVQVGDMPAYRPSYRIDPADAGTPEILIVEAGDALRLYPAPSYTLAGALVLRGLAALSRELWPTEQSECPLPSRVQADAVILGLAARIGDTVPSKAALAQQLERRYRVAKGRAEAERSIYDDNHRTSAYADGYYAPVGPLNM
jgi:hypothetical protein